ncbi:MAG TPA: hypothetical protein VF886_18420 [Roseiarcus sp.]
MPRSGTSTFWLRGVGERNASSKSIPCAPGACSGASSWSPQSPRPTTVFYDDTEGLFGEMQSLCADCSNRKRTPNGLGYVDDIGLDGYPVDPRHPFNRPRS